MVGRWRKKNDFQARCTSHIYVYAYQDARTYVCVDYKSVVQRYSRTFGELFARLMCRVTAAALVVLLLCEKRDIAHHDVAAATAYSVCAAVLCEKHYNIGAASCYTQETRRTHSDI